MVDKTIERIEGVVYWLGGWRDVGLAWVDKVFKVLSEVLILFS
jgi:hypothetical protein